MHFVNGYIMFINILLMYLMHVNAFNISVLKKETLPNLNKNLFAVEGEMYFVIHSYLT